MLHPYQLLLSHQWPLSCPSREGRLLLWRMISKNNNKKSQSKNNTLTTSLPLLGLNNNGYYGSIAVSHACDFSNCKSRRFSTTHNSSGSSKRGMSSFRPISNCSFRRRDHHKRQAAFESFQPFTTNLKFESQRHHYFFSGLLQSRQFSTNSDNNNDNININDNSNSNNNNDIARFFPSLSKEAATASPLTHPTATNRLLHSLPPAVLIHLSIGSVYVYSMYTPSLSQALGVVAAAPLDWTHSQLLPVFSLSALVLGVTTSRCGEWVERAGPRMAGMAGSAFWSGALITTALGVEHHCLPMVYAGYGVLGGVGWGLMYLTPVTSVMKWFPDKRGLATGMALSAFGAGAAVAPSLIHGLVELMAVAPEFVGECCLSYGGGVELTTLTDGSQVIASNSPLGQPGTPVVVATEADIAKCSGFISTGPGVYAVGTGDTGVAKAMASLGVLYGVMGAVGSRFMKIPHPDWSPTTTIATATATATAQNCNFLVEQRGNNCNNQKDGLASTNISDKNKVDKKLIINDETNYNSNNNIIINDNNIGLPASYVTTNTTQFPLLWLSVFGNATGGLALLSSSKLMLTDIFAGVAPDIVTPTFSTGYVSALGIGMAIGRFGWSAMSDVLGRQATFGIFGLGIPIVGLTPYLCHAVVDASSGVGAIAGSGIIGGEEVALNVWPYLMTFYSGSVLAITFYGGIFSTLPAYIADLFGQKHAGAIHGKALTAWAASAVAGPMGLAYLRSHSHHNAMQDLLHTVETHDASAMERSFGCSIQDEATIQKLIDAKTLTIEKLMEMAPAGTVDPTPFLYDSTCYVAAGLMSVAALSNLAIRPLDLKKAIKELEEAGEKGRSNMH